MQTFLSCPCRYRYFCNYCVDYPIDPSSVAGEASKLVSCILIISYLYCNTVNHPLVKPRSPGKGADTIVRSAVIVGPSWVPTCSPHGSLSITRGLEGGIANAFSFTLRKLTTFSLAVYAWFFFGMQACQRCPRPYGPVSLVGS